MDNNNRFGYQIIAPYKDGSVWLKYQDHIYKKREVRRGAERCLCPQAGCPATLRVRNGVVTVSNLHIHDPLSWMQERTLSIMLNALSGVSPESEGALDGGAGGTGEKALLTRTPTHSTYFLDKHGSTGKYARQNGAGCGARTSASSAGGGRRTFAFWTLVTLLLVLAVGNLLLTFTILGVLRLGRGMKSIQFIPEQRAVKLLGLVELEHVYKRDGLLEGWRDVPVRFDSDNGSVLFNLQGRQSQPETKLRVNGSGIYVRGVSGMRVRDRAGRPVFSSDARTVHMPAGARTLAAQIISAKRIASPVDEPLNMRSDNTVHLRGAEGTHMESKELLWSADQDIYLKSVNGSVILSGKEGVFIDVKNIPIALPHLKTDSKYSAPTGQFKVCVCMPQGKLFRIAVPTGQKTSCSHVNMTADHNPCL